MKQTTPEQYKIGGYALRTALILSSLWLSGCSGDQTTAPLPPPSATQYTLSVSVTGAGNVTSSLAGISCGIDCTESYASGQSVTLTATAGNGYQFSSWSGACSGTGSCMVAMNANRSVTATFTNSTTQILFEERFDISGNNLTYGFDGWLFGHSNQLWTMRDHLQAGGVNNGPAFRATSAFDSFIIGDDASIGAGGTSYYFLKNLTGNLADHSRDFWVRQCMKYSSGYLDARTRGPIGAKINYFIASGGGFLEYTPIAGTFQARERVVGRTSSARANLFSPDPASARSTNLVGSFQVGEILVGETSGATATFQSFSPEERTIGFNHFWHPGSAPLFRADNYLELVWYDLTSDHYFGSNNPLNQVQHSNWLLLQDHYDEWMCLETHIDLDQVPWLVEIYVTTTPGAATLAAGTTALDMNGRRQFNDYLYIRYSNPTAPALDPGFGIDFNQYGAFGLTLTNDEIYFDEYLISTGKVGHPFR